MKKSSIQMTSGSIKKNMLLFSIPLIFTNLLQVLFNMADLAVVGQYGGKEALGAVGSTTTLVVLFVGFFIGMGAGVNSLCALFIGSKSKKDLEETVHTSIILCFSLGIVFMVFCLLFADTALTLLGTKEELFEGASRYLHIYFYGLPAVSVYNFGNGVYSAAGKTKKPLTFLTISGVINVLLNLFTVIVLNMDVAGVAIATVTAQYISATLVVISLFSEKEDYGLQLKKFGLNKNKALRLLGLGVPAGLQNAIFQFANLFIQAGVNSFEAVTVEGNSAAANADGIVYNIMNAFYVACTSFISQNYGEKKRDRIKESFHVSLAYSFLAGLIPGVLLVVFGNSFLSIFTHDAQVIAEGLKRLTVMGFSYCISAFMDNTIAAARGLGKTGVPTILVILGSCVFRILWIFTVFAHFRTLESLYLLYAFSWTITAISEIIYYKFIFTKLWVSLEGCK